MEYYDRKAAIRLASEIIKEACNDYLKICKAISKLDNRYNRARKEEAKKWFYSDHASFLLCGSNPDAIIRELDKLAENKVFNIKRRYRP